MRPLYCAVTLVGLCAAVGLGSAALGPIGLVSPSEATLEQAAGGCQLPSASCFLSDACVNEGGTWFYYFYKGGGMGADTTNFSNPRCFEKWRYSNPNCNNANSAVIWYVCT